MDPLTPQLPEKVRRAARDAVRSFAAFDVEAGGSRQDRSSATRQQVHQAIAEVTRAMTAVAPGFDSRRAFLEGTLRDLNTLLEQLQSGMISPQALQHIEQTARAAVDTASSVQATASAAAATRAALIAAGHWDASPGRGAVEAGLFTGEERGAIHRELTAASPAYRAASDKAEAEIRAEQPQTLARQAKIMGLSAALGIDTSEAASRIKAIRSAKEKALAESNIDEAARLEAEEQTELAAQSAEARKAADEKGNDAQKAEALKLDEEQQRKKEEAIQRFERLRQTAIEEARALGKGELADSLAKDRDAIVKRMRAPTIEAEDIDKRTELEQPSPTAEAIGAALQTSRHVGAEGAKASFASLAQSAGSDALEVSSDDLAPAEAEAAARAKTFEVAEAAPEEEKTPPASVMKRQPEKAPSKS